MPAGAKRREHFGLPADRNIYLCAQHLGKIHGDFDRMLADILRRDGRGIVVLTADRFGQLAAKLRQRFAAVMPVVSDRICFLPRQSHHDYLALLAAADVLLDPPHFGGVNSTYDGLSLGKPVVTMPSGFHRGRYTYGCYRKMGMTECIATDREDYVARAVALGTDADYRRMIEGRIREASRVLFEDHEAVSEHERLFRELLT